MDSELINSRVTSKCNGYKKYDENKSVLIDKFNKIRDIIRIIYLYSSYNNNEVFKVSERTLRNEKRIIKNIFEENCKETYEKRKKYVGLCYDAVIHSKNFLSQAYFIRNFQDYDFILYFFILEVLNESHASMDDIIEKYENASGTSDDEENTASETTIERNLKRLLEEGLIDRVREGKKFLYKSKSGFFEDFTLEEKELILNIAIFLSEITPYKVPGYYLQETIKSDSEIMNLNYYDNEGVYRDWYYFPGNQIHSILDEIMLFDIEENRFVEIENEVVTQKACYLYRVIDPIYGRLYAMTRGIDEHNLVTDEHIIFRVDKVKRVTPLGKQPDNLDEIDFNKRLKMWNCSIPLDKTRTLETKTVQAIFYIDDDKVYERLVREKKWGTLEEISEGQYLFTIDVMEPKELIPWFRMFEGYVVILDEELNQQFRNERDELLKRYGVF